MKNMFSGTGVALATPFRHDLSVDFNSLHKLMDYTVEGRVDYLVVLGTTGESPVCSWKEKLEILSFILKKNNRRLPVVFGLGGNNTFDLIDKSKDLSGFEIDAILSTSPYYNKPSQPGIIRHYQLLADAFPKPIILYNVPSRTASNVSPESTLKLSEHENIIGMKEASGDLDQCKRIIGNKPSDFLLLSGDDQLTCDMIKNGADGVISVVGNILPFLFTQMVNTALKQDFEEAFKLNTNLRKAYELLSKEGNPSSLKSGLKVHGLCENTVRPPLFEGSKELEAEWSQFLSVI